MKILRRFLLQISGMLRPANREQEFCNELEAHLALAIDDLLHRGCPPDQARCRAILQLGGLEPTRQAYRESSTLPALEDLLQDVRFTLRQLRGSVGFTATAVLTLAVGICASVAIFAFVDAALLKPLPYVDPNRLVGVFESITLGPHFNLSYPDYLDWKRENTVFTSLEAYQRTGFFMAQPTGLIAVHGARVSDEFFTTLGVQPAIGRNFAPGEDLPSAPRVHPAQLQHLDDPLQRPL